MEGFTVSTVRVTPEQLYSAAEEVIQKTSQAKTVFADMGDTIKRTDAVWLGEAAEAHRTMFEAQVPQIDAIFARFEAHASHLREIAANYAGTETQITAAAEVLPGDVIQ